MTRQNSVLVLRVSCFLFCLFFLLQHHSTAAELDCIASRKWCKKEMPAGPFFPTALCLTVFNICNLFLSINAVVSACIHLKHQHHHLRTAELEATYGSSSPTPVKEAQWGIELPASDSTSRCKKHWAIQQIFHFNYFVLFLIPLFLQERTKVVYTETDIIKS